MANQTMFTSFNLDSPALSGLLSGEDITIRNNAILTINSDSISSQSNAVIGNITINSSEGGQVIIDGTKVWELPFDSSTGNVPRLNDYGIVDVTGATSLATGEMLGVWSYSTLPPISANIPAISASLNRMFEVTMPTSGFIKLRSKTGNFLDNETVNLYNGATVTVNHPNGGKRGWLNIIGEEGSTINVPRVGTFTAIGDWYELGETDGTDDQVFQFFAADEPPAISIEISAGAGNYEWWTNAGNRWGGLEVSTIQTIPTDERGKFFGTVNFASAPLRTIDYLGGRIQIARRSDRPCGYKPPAGCKVRVPNIHVSNRRSPYVINTISTTPATRWDFTTTSAGVVNLDKVGGNWYLSCSAPYSVNFKDSSFMHQILLSNAANYSYIDNCAVGCSTHGATNQSPLNFTKLLTGISIKNSTFFRQSMASANDANITLTDINDLTFENNKVVSAGNSTTIPYKGNGSVFNINITRVNRGLFNNNTIIGGLIQTTQSTDLSFNNTSYADLLAWPTSNGNAGYAFTFTNSTYRANINGFSAFANLPNSYPGAGIASYVNSYDCKIRNIGTPEVPYVLRSVASAASGCALIINAADSTEIEAKKIYTTGVRTAALGTANTAQNLILEHVWADENDIQANAWVNNTPKGCRWANSAVGQISVYGKHWEDCHNGRFGVTNATSGYVLISCNEALDTTAEQCSATQGSPLFTSTGALSMQTSGDQITWTMPYYAIGHESFAPVEPIVSLTGLTKQNTVFNYRLADGRNDIETYGNWKSLIAANLSGETFTPSAGFKLQVTATTVVTSATNSMTFIRIETRSTSANQALAYPLATPLITFTDVPSSAIAAGYDSTNFTFQGWSLAGDANTVGVKVPWNNNHNDNFRIRAPGYSTIDSVVAITEENISTPASVTEYTTIPKTDPGVLSISAMYHETPVNWNGKDFNITVQLLDNAVTSAQVANYINFNTAKIQPFFGRRGVAWPEMIIPNTASYETKAGILYCDACNFGLYSGVRVVKADGTTFAPGFTRFQSNDGSYYTPPVLSTISAPNISAGSRVQLYNVTTNTEIENLVLGSPGYTYNYYDGSGISAGDTLRFRATYQNGLLATDLIESVATAAINGASFGASQSANSVYTSNAIDGSTCTEFTSDYPNVEIDINDPDGVTTPMRLFAWYHYIVTTQFGIANFFNGITAIDSVNYQINVNVMNMLLDNVSALPVKINDAYMYRSDGTTVIASGSGSIQMDPGRAYIANSSVINTKIDGIANNTGLIPALL